MAADERHNDGKQKTWRIKRIV